MAQEKLSITCRIQSDDLVTWGHRGSSDKLILCFSGIGKDSDSIPPYEFAQTATAGGQHSVLFISDPKRTWLNGPDLIARISQEVADFSKGIEVARVVAMGHSMGGFSALVAPSFTRVDAVLAFAPQISVHPKHVPDEKRWPEFRERIQSFALETAESCLKDETQYTVIHGRHGREAPQRDRFPRQENLRHYIMPQTHHNVPQRLKDMGCLADVVHLAIEGRARKLLLCMKNNANAVLLPQSY